VGSVVDKVALGQVFTLSALVLHFQCCLLLSVHCMFHVEGHEDGKL